MTPLKVSRILKNPHYTGYTFWDYRNKNDNFAKSLEPAHPAIVSPEEFKAVQRKLASRRPNVVHPQTVAVEYLFNDLGFCAQCGHKMIIKGGKGGKYHYFVCSKRFKYGKRACDIPRYPLVKNDPIIMSAIIHDILNQETLKTLIRQVHSISAPNCHTTEQKLADLDSRTADLDSRESQLLIALEMQTFSFAKIQERMAIIQDQRNKIEEERQAIIAETDTEEAFLNDPNLILAYAKYLTTYLRKATVRSANAIPKRFIKSLAFEKGFLTINYMIPLPDATPVGTDYRRLSLDGLVRPTISVAPGGYGRCPQLALLFRLTPASLSRHIKGAVEASGHGSGFKGHSCRAGMAQDLAVAGIGETFIDQAGRWKDRSSRRRYTSKNCGPEGRGVTVLPLVAEESP